MDATHTGIAAHQAAAVHHPMTAVLLAAVHHTTKAAHTVKCPSGPNGWVCSFKAGYHGQAVAGQSANPLTSMSGTTMLVILAAVAIAVFLIVRGLRGRTSS